MKENVCQNQNAFEPNVQAKKFIHLKENSHDSTERFRINMAQRAEIRQK
jgi:hypothetical protein